ncbi:hypothetical protein IJO12_01265 [bacterium]|nr:hypothetical protein [bacterium]
MRVDKVSNNVFKGNIVLNKNKKMSAPVKNYLNQVLDYELTGGSLRKRIQKSPYDLNVYVKHNKQTKVPKLFFSSTFNVLDKRYDRSSYASIRSTYASPDLKITEPVQNGAEFLESFLNAFENRKNAKPYSYYTSMEMIKVFIKKNIFDRYY